MVCKNQETSSLELEQFVIALMHEAFWKAGALERRCYNKGEREQSGQEVSGIAV